MCGRFSLKEAEVRKVAVRFRATVDARLSAEPMRPRYNIAPTQNVLTVRMEGEERVLGSLKWGLVPSWAKDASVGNQMTNARAETVRERLAYRQLFRTRRCLVPCDAFYEWTGERAAKQPYAFARADGALFAIAGLWDVWSDPKSGAVLETVTLITTQPNAIVSVIHDRMPAILHAADEEAWLTDKPDAAAALLRPFGGEMQSWPVSRKLNSARFDDESLIAPVRVSEQPELF